MRIVHYMKAIDFKNGGPPRAVVDQVATMRRRGHETGILTTNAVDVPRSWPDDSMVPPEVVELEPASRLMRRLPPRALDRARAMIRTFDVVHLHGIWESSNLQIARIAREESTPYVVSLRGMLDDWAMSRKSLKKRVYLRLGGVDYLRHASGVHCTAGYELEQSRKWFDGDRTTVIPNLIDETPYLGEPDPKLARGEWSLIEEGTPTVLFLSRLHPGKGVDILLEGMALVRDRGLDARLVVAGNGAPDHESFLRAEVDRLGLQDRACFVGHVSGDLKHSLFAAADVFALPTSQENFGFVMFEALFSGTPVVTTNLVDTRDEIRDSGGGVIVDRTPEAFADAIASFIEGRRDPVAMGRAGRRWTLEHLSSDRVAAAFEELYRSCGVD